MYMCVKLPLGDLNPNPYPLHLTSIYTCRVTIMSRVHIGDSITPDRIELRKMIPKKFSIFLKATDYSSTSHVMWPTKLIC